MKHRRTFLLPVNHRLSSLHTTLGTFNLLCLSKRLASTELTRLRKQSEMQVREGVLMRARMLYSRIGADLGVLSCLFWWLYCKKVILKPPHAYYDEYCSGFVRPNPKQQNVGAELWSFGYEKRHVFHSIGRSSFALAPRLYKQKRSVEHKQNPHAWPVCGSATICPFGVRI